MATYESAIQFIKKAEGGLSNAATDTASVNPSPYVYQGKTGWHTNRGIQWATFKEFAKQGGYAINENNFIRMPDSVWLAIYKIGFWNPMKGDNYTSQALANTVVDFAFNAGPGRAERALIKFLKTKNITASNTSTIAEGFNKLTKEKGEQKIFNELIDFRKNWYLSLNQPANEKGWLARMEELRKQGGTLLGKSIKMVKAHKVSAVLVILGLGTMITGIVLLLKKK